MHVPDGFLAPITWMPATAIATGAAVAAARRAARDPDGPGADPRALPRLAVLTALAFVLESVAIPVPGGTSVHATGVALLATQFGVGPAYLAVVGVLALQALVFGVGGVTSLGLNALCIGLAGAAVAVGTVRLLGGIGVRRDAALFVAAWLSVVVPAALLAAVLGAQPLLGRAPDGTPLWFPFGWTVTFPALLVPTALLGIGEGALTVVATRFLGRVRPAARSSA